MRLIKNSIIPIAAILLIVLLGQYIYIVDGQIDWFRFCMVLGVPFGIPYMLFVIPIGGSISIREQSVRGFSCIQRRFCRKIFAFFVATMLPLS